MRFRTEWIPDSGTISLASIILRYHFAIEFHECPHQNLLNNFYFPKTKHRIIVRKIIICTFYSEPLKFVDSQQRITILSAVTAVIFRKNSSWNRFWPKRNSNNLFYELNTMPFSMHHKGKMLIRTRIIGSTLYTIKSIDTHQTVFQLRGWGDSWTRTDILQTISKHLSASLSNLPISITMFFSIHPLRHKYW